MDTMEFSVSMCVYGGDNPQHFEIALASVMKQTLKPTEVVLTVDGPIPTEIENVIDKYNTLLIDSNINFKIVRLNKNMGHGEARRKSFDNCKYDLIALMDSDDICTHERFEKQINFLKKHPEVTIVGGYITEFISVENPTDTTKHAGKRLVPIYDNEIKEYMKKRCPMNQVTVMFKKKDIEEVGGYIDWYCEEDYYLWIRLALADKVFANLPCNLVNVRVGEEMYQRRGGIEYFKSEAKLQKFMLDKKIISFPRFFINVVERWIIQVLLPNNIRSWIFQMLARN